MRTTSETGLLHSLAIFPFCVTGVSSHRETDIVVLLAELSVILRGGLDLVGFLDYSGTSYALRYFSFHKHPVYSIFLVNEGWFVGFCIRVSYVQKILRSYFRLVQNRSRGFGRLHRQSK